VKKLVEKLGGSITVESEVDEGTSFTLELRKAPESVA
jgi:signal transduction histidine kinase